MTRRAILLLALVTAPCAACNGRSSENAVEGTVIHERSAGAERGLPEVETYAHRLDDPSRDGWQKPEEVVALLNCPRGGTVVDLGAGTGYFLPFLSPAVGEEGRVLGLDIAPETVDWLRDRADKEGLTNVDARTVAADDPGLGRRLADRILVVNTWHHIDRRVAYAKKLLRALRKDGRLLIVDFTMDAPMGPPAQKRLRVDTVTGELEAAGFETEVLEETLPYQYVIAGRKR